MAKTDSYIACCGKKINIYTIGMIIWLILWIIITFITISCFSWSWWYLLYSIPIYTGFYVLKNNYNVWNKKIELQPYNEEVNLIEFVERNANYIILGVTALFIASEMIFRSRTENLTGFYVFQLLSLLFAIGLVLPLLWKPRKENEAIELALLRHWKTVWYTYSIYFFLSAVLALVFTLIGIK